MPGFDGTGPRGMGPMTGGGRGFCNPYYAGVRSPYGGPYPYSTPYGTGYVPPYGAGYSTPYTAYSYGAYGLGRGFGWGRGLGGGRGFGWGRGFGRGRWW
jgi:hypothetical protein